MNDRDRKPTINLTEIIFVMDRVFLTSELETWILAGENEATSSATIGVNASHSLQRVRNHSRC